MIAVSEILAQLDGTKQAGEHSWMARCPAHDDHNGSLSVTEGDDGRPLLHCHAGCKVETVVEALGCTMADLMPDEPAKRNGLGKPTATYPYVDEAGELLYEVVRFEPKTFRQRRPDGEGGWEWRLNGVRRVLYHLPRLIGAVGDGKAIVVCEGEKDVEALEALGIVATCNAGGAGKWRNEYSETVVGSKLAVVLPDNDEPGRKHAAEVTASLARAGVPHVTVELPDLPDHGDASDWTAAGGTKKALNELIAIARKAPAQTAAEPTSDPAADKATEPKSLIVWASDVVARKTEWLWERRIPRGTVTIGFGEPGGGKTHAALDIVTRVSRGSAWPDGGRAAQSNCLILSGEDDWSTTLRPRLEYAQAELDRVAFFPAVEAFDERGRRTFALSTDAATLEHNVRLAQAAFVMVDPLTCFLGGVDINRQNEVRVALTILADVAERTGAAVFCILHPTKNDHAGVKALNRLSGSGAFGAAARSVMAVVNDCQDETEERRLLLPVKLNIARMPEGIGFRIVSDDPSSSWSGVAWDSDPVETDADEAFGVSRPDTPQMVKAKAFLRRVLAGGDPYPATTAQEEAEAQGINPKTLQRAKKKLGVVSRLDGFGGAGKWTWQLATTTEDEQ